MVAPRKVRKIVCTVIRVPENTEAPTTRNRASQHRYAIPRFATRPSDLLPWADPYIAQLVQNLQTEVRDERAQANRSSVATGSPIAEMEPPCPSTEPEWPWSDWRR